MMLPAMPPTPPTSPGGSTDGSTCLPASHIWLPRPAAASPVPPIAIV
jgi:hypothetical protein